MLLSMIYIAGAEESSLNPQTAEVRPLKAHVKGDLMRGTGMAWIGCGGATSGLELHAQALSSQEVGAELRYSDRGCQRPRLAWPLPRSEELLKVARHPQRLGRHRA